MGLLVIKSSSSLMLLSLEANLVILLEAVKEVMLCDSVVGKHESFYQTSSHGNSGQCKGHMYGK